jgi:hypothetical protein
MDKVGMADRLETEDTAEMGDTGDTVDTAALILSRSLRYAEYIYSSVQVDALIFEVRQVSARTTDPLRRIVCILAVPPARSEAVSIHTKARIRHRDPAPQHMESHAIRSVPS